MAILRRRRGRPASPVETPVEKPAQPERPKLEERLAEIAAAAAAPEDALEPALHAILESTAAQAGALCLFDARHQMMRLTSEVGLSEEGCARLRSVRRGDPSSWDMPLHGLLNRRAYLIESAPRNRYVPPLVEDTASVRCVTCVPVYANGAPLGSIILIAFAPRTFVERDIRTMEPGLRQLGAMIEAVRRRGGAVEEPAAPRPVLPPAMDVDGLIAERDRLRMELAAHHAQRADLAADVAARAGEIEHVRVALAAANDERVRLATELERAQRQAERAVTLTTALATAERERARLAEALEAAAAERAAQTQAAIALEETRATAEQAAAAALADLETTRRVLGTTGAEQAARIGTLEAELASLTARLAEAEAGAEQARERAYKRDGEIDRLTADLHTASTREHQLRTELRQAGERLAADGQDELRRALDAVRATEEERAAALAELESTRQALASNQEIVLALEDEATYAHVEIERLDGAERHLRVVHDRADQELAEARARAREATDRLGQVERELESLRHERSRLSARDAETAARLARQETLAAERDRLQEALTETAADRDRLRADLEGASARQTRAEESLAREAAERARLAATLAEVQAAHASLEATRAHAESEAAVRTTELDRLRAERAQLSAERDRLLATAAMPGPTPVVDAPSTPEPVRVVTVAMASAPRRTRETHGTSNVICVVDLDGAWERAQVEGHGVAVMQPSADIAERLAEASPTRIVVNLATPGGLEALIALRAGGSRARVWGCLAAPQSDRVLTIGMIEPAVRPLDPDAVMAALNGYATKGTRVVTAGADVDALMSLRQALARQGMSVSMAWDAKQAVDLFPVVRPEVVVVDLALPRRDGYTIVAGLAHVDPPPSTVLLPGEGDAAAAFAAAMIDPRHGARFQARATALAATLGRSEAAPVERRQKVRALGRK